MKKINLRKYHCPISFIKAKIILNKLKKNEKILLILNNEKDTNILIKTIKEEGYTVLNSLKNKKIFKIEVLKN
tara:strand:- start:323 stop:541 length:219 start_codon:yes stop_codon:yes gene_type:complete